MKWILGDKEQAYILCDYFYIVEGLHTCFRCHNKTKVIGYGIHHFFDICNPDIYDTDEACNYQDDEIRIASHISVNASYLANHCSHCQVIQGDFYLFGEVDSPFFLDTADRARKLRLYKIPLKHYIIVDMEIGWSSGDWMIDEYAEKVNFTWV